MANTKVQVKKALLKFPNGDYIIPYTDTKDSFEVCQIGQALYIDESQGLRRYLNGSTVDINDNTQEFLNKLKSIKAVHPQLFCDEDRWWNISSKDSFGQCGKFVINETGGYLKNNCTLNGNLTSIDNVISGFLNRQNYITIPNGIPYSTATKSLEIVLKVTVDELEVVNALIGNSSDAPAVGGLILRTFAESSTVTNKNRLYLWGTTNSSSWTTTTTDTGIDITKGTQYIKLTYNGTAYQVHRSTDGQQWTSGNLITSAPFANTDALLGTTGSSSSFYLRGSLDLKESYIKINGNSYWTGTTAQTTTPYVRLPRVVYSQGTLTLSTLGNLSSSITRRIVAQKLPTLADTRYYNWYSDGWLEQGGYVLQNNATNANWTSYTISLLKPYRDTLYNVVPVTGHTTNTDSPCIRNVTTTSFQMTPYNSSGDAQWVSKGWAKVPALSDYNIGEGVGDVQYPYFIQIASGQATTAMIRNDLSQMNPFNLFDYKLSETPSNNASWIKSNRQYYSKALYPTAYEALQVELNNSIQTGETVQLPSGPSYTKHLQTLTYEPTRITKAGNPTITDNGIFNKQPTRNDYVKFPVNREIIRSANSWSLAWKMQMQSSADSRIIMRNETIAASPRGMVLNFSSKGIEYHLSSNLTSYDIVDILNTNLKPIAGAWYNFRFSYNYLTGYKMEYSTDEGITWTTCYTLDKKDRMLPDADYFCFNKSHKDDSMHATAPVDLKTIIFTYDEGDGKGNKILSCAKYNQLVITKPTTENATTDKQFIVDTTNGKFRLPIYNSARTSESTEDLYYFIGNTAQNTSLVDMGRMTESLGGKLDSDKFYRNYGFQKWNQTTLTVNNSTSKSITITGKGRPVYLSITGDINPTTDTGWCTISLAKNGVDLCRQIDESRGNSLNIPFSLNWLDTNISAGETAVYTATIYQNSGTAIYGEGGDIQAPQFTAYEI